MANNIPSFLLSEDLPQINCENVCPNKLNSNCRNYKDNTFSIIGHNIRSCRKNFSSFLSFLALLTIHFTVIVLYETWLSEITDFGFEMPGYADINIYRNNFGGGIKIFYESSYNVEILNELSFVNNVFESLVFILSGHGIKYLIISLYRPPNSDPNVFIEMLTLNILSKLDCNEKIILIGDVNINLFNPYNLLYVDSFMNSLLSYSFFPIITLPSKHNYDNIITRFSLIDQIWGNFFEGSDHFSGIVNVSITDHFPIFYMFKTFKKIKKKLVKFRLIDNTKIQIFIDQIRNLNLENILTGENINVDFGNFYDCLFNLYNRCFPIKQKRIKEGDKRVPWMSMKLKKCIKKNLGYLIF